MMVFRPNTSSYQGAGVAIPQVIMSTVYDSEITPPENQSAAENQEYTTSDEATQLICHPVECDPSLNQVSIRNIHSSNGLDDRDQNLNDAGIFQIASVGAGSANQLLGRLYVYYTVSLLKPSTTSNLAAGSTCLVTGTSPPNVITYAPYYYHPGNSLDVKLTESIYSASELHLRVEFPLGVPGTFQVTIIVNGNSNAFGGSGFCRATGHGTDIVPAKLIKSEPAYAPLLVDNECSMYTNNNGGQVFGDNTSFTPGMFHTGFWVSLGATENQTYIDHQLFMSPMIATQHSITVMVTYVDNDVTLSRRDMLNSSQRAAYDRAMAAKNDAESRPLSFLDAMVNEVRNSSSQPAPCVAEPPSPVIVSHPMPPSIPLLGLKR